MKLYIFCFCKLLILISCNNRDKQIHAQNKSSGKDFKSQKISSETLFDSSQTERILKWKRMKSNYNVTYYSAESDSGWSKIYEVNDLKLSFKNKYLNHLNNREIFFNNQKIKRYPYGNLDGISIDSMDMNIDYTESGFYTFENDPSYLLVLSKPMNWVGTMTRYSFFQLISLKQNNVIEFIREEE